ncbi:alpha-ketoacid dehydrogenase subunit alpha/beta [Schauerella aestuarii]|uniref:alpha-ketoacid dehydrogenase subunit alpha/beta n=1 Tax=Schauerella aestuarii TaxID=2511204 RepID=UPI00136B23E3|nr:alpha-ketoacid dehydrogenase subunit alpha/beta [Achromobacter aestuarii]MYZ44659.1 MFS transporter [Achromobacter aestuarii]
MTTYDTLTSTAPWRAVHVTAQDWHTAPPTLLATMLTQLHWIRAFEETVLDLAAAGLVHGPAHSSIGQEGGAVASILALGAGDQINGSHRGHHQFLAKALQHVAPDGLDPRAAHGAAIDAVLQKTLAEIMGLAQGFCRGRGGSMHLRWLEAGALGTNAIVGGGVPLAAGAAWAHRHAGTDRVAVTYFGDGAINIGSVLETMNLTAAWKTPLCFFVENNRYAVSTTVEEATAEPRLSARGQAFNIPAWKVDGMDPLAVHTAMAEAVAHMRAGHGPTIIEADVYRFFHQNGPFPGSAFGYRTKEEEATWRARDPLLRVATEMVARELITADEIDSLRARCKATMQEIAERLTEAGEGAKRQVRVDLWPRADFRDVGLRSDQQEFVGMRVQEAADYAGTTVTRKLVDAVADVVTRRMETDASIVVMGEDVHRLKGGTNGATRGLKDRFPDRVLGTPISENAFAGLGGGLAMDGRYRPIVEFMYPDFMWVAADQIFNQIGKARHMFGGDIDVPLVLRTKVAMGTGYGSQHSMDPAGIVATSPGWRIVAPSTPYDYIGLMNTALLSRDPVLVIEHVDLYASSGEIPADDLDYFIPFGSACVRRAGSKVTVLTYLAMVDKTLQAVEALGVDAEVIDLRTLDRASLDWDTIGASVRKTNNVLIVEQGARGTSYGAMLSDEIQRRLFDWLDQPVKRVTGGEASPSISKVLERAAFAGVEEVMDGLRDVLADLGEAS